MEDHLKIILPGSALLNRRWESDFYVHLTYPTNRDGLKTDRYLCHRIKQKREKVPEKMFCFLPNRPDLPQHGIHVELPAAMPVIPTAVRIADEACGCSRMHQRQIGADSARRRPEMMEGATTAIRRQP